MREMQQVYRGLERAPPRPPMAGGAALGAAAAGVAGSSAANAPGHAAMPAPQQVAHPAQLPQTPQAAAPATAGAHTLAGGSCRQQAAAMPRHEQADRAQPFSAAQQSLPWQQQQAEQAANRLNPAAQHHEGCGTAAGAAHSERSTRLPANASVAAALQTGAAAGASAAAATAGAAPGASTLPRRPSQREREQALANDLADIAAGMLAPEAPADAVQAGLATDTADAGTEDAAAAAQLLQSVAAPAHQAVSASVSLTSAEDGCAAQGKAGSAQAAALRPVAAAGRASPRPPDNVPAGAAMDSSSAGTQGNAPVVEQTAVPVKPGTSACVGVAHQRAHTAMLTADAGAPQDPAAAGTTCGPADHDTCGAAAATSAAEQSVHNCDMPAAATSCVPETQVTDTCCPGMKPYRSSWYARHVTYNSLRRHARGLQSTSSSYA